ncbi:MAG TPA: type II secretion system protein GspM [Azonexus sp.]|nr:type II secretion system protein GspM [Azonexus sp.]
MKSLRQEWDRLNARYVALSQRERSLVAAAMVLGPLLIGYSLFLDPQTTRLKGLEQGIARQQASVVEMQTQIASLQQNLRSDPDAPQKAELAALTAERNDLDKQLQQLGSVLVRPEEMNGLLSGLLVRHADLRLVSLKTLAPQGVLHEAQPVSANDKKPAERAFDLYRHGVEIRLEGSYGALQSYLAQLEKMPQRLLWQGLSYRVINYPRAEMTLTVFTLSPDRTWLAL